MIRWYGNPVMQITIQEIGEVSNMTEMMEKFERRRNYRGREEPNWIVWTYGGEHGQQD
jgi:hypothetical protein